MIVKPNAHTKKHLIWKQLFILKKCPETTALEVYSGYIQYYSKIVVQNQLRICRQDREKKWYEDQISR